MCWIELQIIILGLWISLIEQLIEPNQITSSNIELHVSVTLSYFVVT